MLTRSLILPQKRRFTTWKKHYKFHTKNLCAHRQQYFPNILQRNQLVSHSCKVSHPREECQKNLNEPDTITWEISFMMELLR